MAGGCGSRCLRDAKEQFLCSGRSREQLWQRFFADPSQWWDNRRSKTNPKQSDFRHKRTLEPLWVDSFQNPSWVKERIAALDSPGLMRQKSLSSNDGDDDELVQTLCKEGRVKDALRLVEQMLQQLPIEEAPKSAYVSILKACARRKLLTEGKWVHALTVQSKCDSDIFLANNLIDMYSKSGSLVDARNVFDAMPRHNVFSWTAIISAYANSDEYEEAINLYKRMQKTAIAPDKIVFIATLKACAKAAALEDGKQIHSRIVEDGFHQDLIVQSALIDMYARCGCLQVAREIFDKMSERDVASWNAMIAVYAHGGRGAEAIVLYEKMKQDGMQANKVTLVCVLKACANIGALEQGKQIHSLAFKKSFHMDAIVQSALVDMYANCGSLERAREVFNDMSKQDVVSWNAMIAGYGQNGLAMEAVALYEQMMEESVQPDGITYICVLSACGQSGMVKESFRVFDLMRKYSGVIPTAAHYACMVNLLGHAGLLAEAKDLITKMPIQPGSVVWKSLLGAARNACDVEVGQHAFDNLVKLDPENAAPYMLLIDIYAHLGRMDKVAELRKEMRNKGLEKRTGCSWIEVDNRVHAFAVGDESHPQSQQIRDELIRLLCLIKKAGYMPHASSLLEDASEKLGIAFGLICVPPLIPIRIKKNCRASCDCHDTTKIISKIIGREINAMDANVFHHFKDGLCSCRDYW